MFAAKTSFAPTNPSTSTGFSLGTATSGASKPAPLSLFGSTSAAASKPSLFGSTAGTTATTTSAPSLFGSTAAKPAGTGLFGGGSLFKPATSTATSTGGLFATSGAGGSLFSKPATSGGGLFASSTAQQQQPTQERATLVGILQDSDALVRSLTSPELYGDERDQLIGRVNQLAAALGVGQGLAKEGQAVSYTAEGPFHRLKAVVYNKISKHDDSEGIVALTMRCSPTELSGAAQKQKLIDVLHSVLGGGPNIKVVIKSIKQMPDNSCEVGICVLNRTSGSPAPSSAVTQTLNETAKKNMLEQQLRVEKIVSCVAMDKFQREQHRKNPPPGFDDAIWSQAWRENPDPENLVPQPIRGFDQLLYRQKAQAAEVETQNVVLEQLVNRVDGLSLAAASAQVQMAQFKVAQKQLSHRLLRVLAMQILQHRFGTCVDSLEEKMESSLDSINARLNAPQQVKPRLDDILAFMRNEGDTMRDAARSAPASSLSESDLLQLGKYLGRCQDGIEGLAQVVRGNATAVKAIGAVLEA